MNKGALVETVAQRLDCTRAEAAAAVDAVLDTVIRSVVRGDRIVVTGFGTFERVERAARYARNPQTGERIRLKKTFAPRFRPGQGFKDLTGKRSRMPRRDVPAHRKAPKGTYS